MWALGEAYPGDGVAHVPDWDCAVRGVLEAVDAQLPYFTARQLLVVMHGCARVRWVVIRLVTVRCTIIRYGTVVRCQVRFWSILHRTTVKVQYHYCTVRIWAKIRCKTVLFG